MRIDGSWLLLWTPMMPPLIGVEPAPKLEGGEAAGGVVPRPPPGGGVVAPGLVGVWVPAPIRSNSLLVMGSRYFLRRNLPCTSTSTLGGNAFWFLALNRATARAYCSPRNTSSASFSRCYSC